MNSRRTRRAHSLLARLQLGLEALYRVETKLAIDAFVIDGAARDRMQLARAPREQLLLREIDGELAMALFVDAAALANLERHDPAARLDDRNFTDFCLAVEGVSHFVYMALAAARARPVSQLELELQAEVDKFVTCFLLTGVASNLRRRLFGDVAYADDLDADERERYRTANREASRYTAALEQRFIDRADSGGLARADGGALARAETTALLAEVRRFYRMDLPTKLGRIAQLA